MRQFLFAFLPVAVLAVQIHSYSQDSGNLNKNQELPSSSKEDYVKKIFYLNITIYQDNLGDENYTLSYNLVPITEDILLSKENGLENPQFDEMNTQSSNPGGLVGSIEYFLKAIPAFPGAAVESIYMASGVPELLGINVTHIWNTTLVNVRKNPIGTAVQTINNVAFCNPLLAGINAGRCRGFFMAT